MSSYPDPPFLAALNDKIPLALVLSKELTITIPDDTDKYPDNVVKYPGIALVSKHKSGHDIDIVTNFNIDEASLVVAENLSFTEKVRYAELLSLYDQIKTDTELRQAYIILAVTHTQYIDVPSGMNRNTIIRFANKIVMDDNNSTVQMSSDFESLL